MASVRERTSKRGETTWAVLYRDAGRQRSQTFVDEKRARKFARLVPDVGPARALEEVAGISRQRHDLLTVDQLAEQFLARKAENVTPRTMEDYRRDYRNWIAPWLGHRAAEDVDEADVQRLVDHMRTKLAPKSVADRHMLLHAMYEFGRAKSRRLVTHNPCLETDLPKRTKRPRKGTSVAEWIALRDAATRRNPDAGDLILFLGSLGWRWSEAAALAVRDVDDDGEHVWVDVTRVFRMVDHRQILVEDAAKSFAGFRRSRVPTEAAAMLRRRIVGKGPTELVFTNSRGRPWNQNTFLRNTWPSLLADSGVGTADRKPTPHWLRHMAVANMARAGVPMHEIQRIIGHEDLKTTNSTYGGMIATLSADAIPRLDAVLSGQTDVVIGEVVTGVDEKPFEITGR